MHGCCWSSGCNVCGKAAQRDKKIAPHCHSVAVGCFHSLPAQLHWPSAIVGLARGTRVLWCGSTVGCCGGDGATCGHKQPTQQQQASQGNVSVTPQLYTCSSPRLHAICWFNRPTQDSVLLHQLAADCIYQPTSQPNTHTPHRLWLTLCDPAESPGVRSIRCCGPAACCLVADLAQEGSQLTLVGSRVHRGGAKAREDCCCCHKGTVGVEALAGTCTQNRSTMPAQRMSE